MLHTRKLLSICILSNHSICCVAQTGIHICGGTRNVLAKDESKTNRCSFRAHLYD